MHFIVDLLVSPGGRLSKDVTEWVVVTVAVGIGPLLVLLSDVPLFPSPSVTGYCPELCQLLCEYSLAHTKQNLAC